MQNLDKYYRQQYFALFNCVKIVFYRCVLLLLENCTVFGKENISFDILKCFESHLIFKMAMPLRKDVHF